MARPGRGAEVKAGQDRTAGAQPLVEQLRDAATSVEFARGDVKQR
eukprot:CAMPEP_0117673092 /NCGR_PEP_ID=MMETSP0804-20121206/14282_1 /TAXON_ID=1074897 /ORGANISM="Tetraselmis astigmatica, Strain CCMP880" /LENGTH=44 /DNA_ID= /DNA_START= /DNA_END= /DNA_ORIENTATION=